MLFSPTTSTTADTRQSSIPSPNPRSPASNLTQENDGGGTVMGGIPTTMMAWGTGHPSDKSITDTHSQPSYRPPTQLLGIPEDMQRRQRIPASSVMVRKKEMGVRSHSSPSVDVDAKPGPVIQVLPPNFNDDDRGVLSPRHQIPAVILVNAHSPKRGALSPPIKIPRTLSSAGHGRTFTPVTKTTTTTTEDGDDREPSAKSGGSGKGFGSDITISSSSSSSSTAFTSIPLSGGSVPILVQPISPSGTRYQVCSIQRIKPNDGHIATIIITTPSIQPNALLHPKETVLLEKLLNTIGPDGSRLKENHVYVTVKPSPSSPLASVNPSTRSSVEGHTKNVGGMTTTTTDAMTVMDSSTTTPLQKIRQQYASMMDKTVSSPSPLILPPPSSFVSSSDENRPHSPSIRRDVVNVDILSVPAPPTVPTVSTVSNVPTVFNVPTVSNVPILTHTKVRRLVPMIVHTVPLSSNADCCETAIQTEIEMERPVIKTPVHDESPPSQVHTLATANN